MNQNFQPDEKNVDPGKMPPVQLNQDIVAPPLVQRPKSGLALKKVLAIVGLALIVIGIAAVYYFVAPRNSAPSTDRQSVTEDGNKLVTKEEEDIASVVEKVSPNVVSVITKSQASSPYYGAKDQEGAGTGIVVGKDGYILTNKHVVQGVSTVSVVLSDGTRYDEVKVIGTDPLNDVAFLKIAGVTNLSAAELGDSTSIRVGQKVVAIGNSLGQYQNTVTSGIISGTGRPISAQSGNSVETLTDLIQTDAAINPGNSGGPLLDISGRLIGVNTAIYSPSGAYAGIGFSVPVDVVNWVVPDLIKYGAVKRPILGIELVQQQSIDRMDLKGALVLNVTPGGAAEKGGVKPTRRSLTGEMVMGDLIIEVNDEPVESNNDLLLTLEKYQPGQEVRLKVKRNNQTTTLIITLGSSL